MRIINENLTRILAALLAAVLLITLMPIPLEVQAANDEKDKKIIVSLGDSYSAGEGIPEFYNQDWPLSERVTNDSWLAHRSTKSWPGMLTVPGLDGTLSEHRDTNWFFVASSGATTEHIQNEQYKDYNKKDGVWGEQYKGDKNLKAQILVFDQFKEGEVDYVTMTLGGNDADFSKVVKNAASNGVTFWNPNELNDKIKTTWNKFYEEGGIRDKLKQAYLDIEGKAGKQACIIIAGYPKLLDPKGSGFLFNEEDATTINQAVSEFNNQIEKLVEECADGGMNIHFVSVEDEFEGHGAYAENPYINPVYIGAKDQDRKPMVASEYSIHPNYEGAKAYARCVQRKINELEGLNYKSYSKNLSVSVLGYDGEPWDDYTITIEGREHIALWGLIGKDYSKTIRVSDDEPFKLRLPEGKFTITVSDGSSSYSERIRTKKNYKNDELIFKTDFGYVPPTDPDEPVFDYVPDRVTSDERDVVLVLDNSGSMNGIPMEETKKASISFVDTVLQYDASIGVVKFSTYAEIVSDFTVDADYLKQEINKIWDYDMTNTYEGLRTAEEMLENSTAKKKIIVLMSDGLPNEGLIDDELVEYAESLQEKGILIYTLGFFSNVGDKAYVQGLMEGIASDGCHYEVESAEDLVFFFDDMADQITGTKYIYIRIACPVDVTVTYNGQTLSSSQDDLNVRTDFGTLTFEVNGNADADSDDRIKILRLKEGVDYDVQIVGTGRGLMDYTIGFMDDDGKYSDLREFEDIKITRKTVIDTVATNSGSTTLKVDEDGDGRYDIRYRAKENSKGEEVQTPWLLIVIIILVLSGAGGGAVVFLKLRNKKKKEKEGN